MSTYKTATDIARIFMEGNDIAPFNDYIREHPVVKPAFVFPFLQLIPGRSEPVEIIIDRGLISTDVIFTYALFAGNEYYSQSLARTGASITCDIDRTIIGHIPESLWPKVCELLQYDDRMIAQCCRESATIDDFTALDKRPAHLFLLDIALALNESNPKYFDIAGKISKKYTNDYFLTVKFWKHDFARELFAKNENIQRMAISCSRSDRRDKLMKLFPDIYMCEMLVGMLNSAEHEDRKKRGIVLDILLQYYFSEVTYCLRDDDPDNEPEYFLCRNLLIDAATSDRPEVFDPFIPRESKPDYIAIANKNVCADTTEETREYLANAAECEAMSAVEDTDE